MTASKNYKKYEAFWGPLFQDFNTHPQREHIVHCKNVKEAKAVRLEFYRARTARQEKDKNDWKDDEDGLQNFGLNRLDEKDARINENDVIFGYKNGSRIAQLLKESLLDPQNEVDEISKIMVQQIIDKGNEDGENS